MTFKINIVAVIAGVLLVGTAPAQAMPEFSRRYDTRCTTCHTVVPRLNLTGMDFLARGYRPAPDLDRERHSTFPASLWLSGRYDDQIAKKHNDVYFNKAEIIAADSVGSNFNYMLEWRVFDLDAQSNGTLRDRSGRFEDAWISWQLSNRLTFSAGQYRPLGQLEPGRKVSVSTPAIFDTSLSGSGPNATIRRLDGFSVNTRSPNLTFAYQSIGGRKNDLAMDGLFHQVTIPFVGEMSLPLSRNAVKNAPFVVQGRAKGVFLETWYRKGYNSVGVHSLIDSDRYLVTGLGTANSGDFYFVGGLGVVKNTGRSMRMTSTLEVEYMPMLKNEDFRPGLGLRIDNVSHNGTRPAFVPYLALSIPNSSRYTTLLQLEYFSQSKHERLRLDLSTMF